MIHTIAIVSLAVLLLSSVCTDLAYGKIFNKITYPCMILGMWLSLLEYGWQGLASSFGGVLVVLLPCLFLIPLAGIGGGDMKMMMAAGSFVGFHVVLWAMAYSAVFGGILALLAAFQRRKVRSSVENTAMSIYLRLTSGVPISDTLAAGNGIKFKYSLGIACGVMLAVFCHT